MSISQGAPLQAPKIFRFNDVDEFRSSIRGLDVVFTPLVRKIAAEQTILNLPGCDVNFTKSFPRIVDARLAGNCTAIGFTMDDHEVPIRFNGAQRDRTAIVIGRGGAAYNTVEQVERQIASVMFTPEVRGRGWPETTTNFRIFETSTLALDRLRSLIREVLAAASEPVDAVEWRMKASAMRESLLAAVDAAFASVVPAPWTARANDERHFRTFRDIHALLLDDLAQPIYSEELAKKLGLSVRSMHDAVQRYQGMSLHRYLRLWRLWLVRKRLLAGPESVKAAALAFGFWHLSDFSRSYRQRFGETPSQTLERARKA
ncbi:helix-turn-helix domain-containing protein [Bradyrhizobium sp. CCGUVB1N3]|uniref:AraC family transcriptional regulator n=1 Tax=Bradyrhizobium sp. CCGUVB1N3 TaxID=2949629 RepID=UPI0020B22A57|nr:AraC family transcriptional regulator [Bradyrhizobium sp. CCGUVB1N3]MCP3469598.1 helix-turn-helix domain-containing protein [Bradyrhizobium sp. CCGUVB1N3]